MSWSSIVDTVLDRTVLPGYSSIGLGIRRSLPGWPDDPPRMDGQTVLVTGSTGGLGYAAAVGFAQLGADVLLLGRDQGRLDEAVARLRRETGADATGLRCDLSSRNDLERLCDEVQQLDVLVNNAGVMAPERTATVDGVETTFATNVLAPFLLTDRLAGLLASRGGRVVNVSSGGMYGQRLAVDDLQNVEGDWHPVRAYARSKRAEVVLTEMWAERLAGSVVVHAMHPGWADTPGIKDSLASFAKVLGPVLRSAAQGADTIVWLGAAPEAAATTGKFWQDRRTRPTHLVPGTHETEQDRQALWSACTELVGGLRSA